MRRIAKAQEERAARLFTMGVAPETAHGQVLDAAARRTAIEREFAVAEQAVAAAGTRQGDRDKAFAVLNALRDRIGDLKLAEKREIIRILVPGGPDYRVEVAKTGEITIKGAIDFTKVASDTTHPYSAACHET